MSWPYHETLLATPVPRYTSYPTAAEFGEDVGSAEYEAALASIAPDAPLSLYLHIPYCHEICWYCGCNTGAANKSQRLTAYLDSLAAEIDGLADRLQGRGKVGRIAFGGGSPNAVAPSDFLRLTARLRDLFGAEDAVISIELDPRSLTPCWVAAIADAGIEMASLGVQTLDPKVQAAIGRVQPQAAIVDAVRHLRDAGIQSINFDLMYGLPGQDRITLAETLNATIAMQPERIALFGYAHVPQIIPRQRRIDASNLPDPEQRFAQAAAGFEQLTMAGYEAVGFDHFALPGDPLAAASREGRLRRNFQGFTEDPAEILIGLGASAISQFPHLIVQNEKNAGRYRMLVSSGRPAACRGVRRDSEDRLRGRIIERLLCDGSADPGALLTPSLLARLAPFEEKGLVARDASTIRILPKARPYARSVAALFDRWRQPGARQFSHAV